MACRGDELMRFHPAAQAMLQAVGVGAQRSLPAAATLNWVLKDGLGRLGRISVGALFGSGFDSDLKVATWHGLACTALHCMRLLPPVLPPTCLIPLRVIPDIWPHF